MTAVVATQKYVEVLMVPISVNIVTQKYVEVLWTTPNPFVPMIYRSQ